ncbi:hypothetical protein CGL57_01215 [Edwardsiella anguillarum]|nr:hypothetical protein CGL57_01215 [Edwardsiella anguillarum]
MGGQPLTVRLQRHTGDLIKLLLPIKTPFCRGDLCVCRAKPLMILLNGGTGRPQIGISRGDLGLMGGQPLTVRLQRHTGDLIKLLLPIKTPFCRGDLCVCRAKPLMILLNGGTGRP